MTKDPIVILHTNLGEIELTLSQKTPKTTENFVKLAAQGYYNGIIFHRVISDFMIQGGDPTGTGMGGECIWGAKFNDEFDASLTHVHGAISMANAGPNTNGSQFFIVTAQSGTPHLNRRHSVFGQVTRGMEIVMQIDAAPTNRQDRPTPDITIKSVQVVEDGGHSIA